MSVQGRVQDLLTRVLARPVHVERCERVEPWFVWRCAIDVAPYSVIVKRLRETPADVRRDPVQVSTEAAALDFLSSIGLDVAPALVAVDLGANLIVTGDLAPRVPLRELLLQGPAREGLLEFARATGELHAATAGLEPAWRSRSARTAVDELEGYMLRRWAEARPVAESVVPFDTAAERDLATLIDTLREPGPFLAFTNGDPGVNNYMTVPGGDGRIIDFEFAGFWHALADISCLYVPGSMWMTVTDPIATGLEDAYRSALARAVPEAEDDAAFGLGIAAGGLGFALARLHRLALMDARPAGHDSRTQMVSCLEHAAQAADAHRALENLAGWACRAAGALRKRWPDADIDLSRLKPYAPRT